jgi:cytosine/adenosine deaminase-related metal-dependent hydrolase
MRDRHSFVYDQDDDTFLDGYGADRAVMEQALRPRYLEPVAAVAVAERIAAACEDDTITVQFGPNGPQWCSDELLRRIAEASAATGRRVHMHLLETRSQRAWADRAHPDGLIRHLDRLGLLSPRLAVAHGVWLRPDEMAQLAARGVTVVVNTSSNLRLTSGRAPVARFLEAGLGFALGLDGFSLDDDDDALRELRLTHLLHGHEPLDPTLDAATLFAAACRRGFCVWGGGERGGRLAADEPADFVTLDWSALADDVLPGTVDPLDLVLARASARHIRRVVVAGREVVRDGRLTGVDLAALERALAAAARREAPAMAALRPLIRRHQERLGRHFAATHARAPGHA